MSSKIPMIPILLLISIALLIISGSHIPLSVQQGFYALSLSIKSIILFVLPVLIFGLLLKAALALAKNATRILGLILIGVICSNFIATFLSHYVGMFVYRMDLSILSPESLEGLTPLWQLELPHLISNAKAMFAGIFIGLLAATLKLKPIYQFSEKFEPVIQGILTALRYIVPFFILGFIVKLQHDGLIATIFQDYTNIIAVIILSLLIYLSTAYFVLSHFQIKKTLFHIRNILPASLAGFLSMSSAAAMPLTILGAKANAKDKNLAHSVIPATVNVHLIGDCFAIPILAFAVLKSFGIAEPSLFSYLEFTAFFVLAKFSVAAIPGGGILVMLPILQSHLGFHADMAGLITALYLLFDPVITAANVLGNGAFAKMIDNIVSRKSHEKKAASPTHASHNTELLNNIRGKDVLS